MDEREWTDRLNGGERMNHMPDGRTLSEAVEQATAAPGEKRNTAIGSVELDLSGASMGAVKINGEAVKASAITIVAEVGNVTRVTLTLPGHSVRANLAAADIETRDA